MPDLNIDRLEYIPASHQYDRPNGVHDIWWILIHTPEFGETPGAARKIANYCSRPDVIGGYHFPVDPWEAFRCAPDTRLTNGAGGANTHSIHISIMGYAGQSSAEWNDTYSKDSIKNAAVIAAQICRRYGIPVVRLTPQDMVAGKKGIGGHIDASNAFHKSDHWDPGPSFPWVLFFNEIKKYLNPQIPEEKEDKEVFLIKKESGGATYVTDWVTKRTVKDKQEFDYLRFFGAKVGQDGKGIRVPDYIVDRIKNA